MLNNESIVLGSFLQNFGMENRSFSEFLEISKIIN
jgi:hypothetical protein